MRLKDAWNRFWFAQVSPAPLCLFRILVGIVAFGDGLLWWSDLTTWFGVNGVFPLESLRHNHIALSALILHPFSDQELYAFLALYLVACIFAIVGFCSRSSMFIIWFFCCSLSNREGPFWHQVGLFVRLYSFMLMIGPCGAMYSVDAWLKKLRGKDTEPKLCSSLVQRLLQIQIALVYLRASVGKMFGSEWQNGTAVYYATHLTNVVRHTVPGFLDNMWFYKVMTYYTVFIETCLWTLIWVPGINKIVLLGGLFLHAGIEWFVNLDFLEWAVVITYVLFLPARDIEWFIGKLTCLVPKR